MEEEEGEEMSKYNSRKTVIDGITFDSAKEARRYAELKLLERAGEISELELQPEYLLLDWFMRFGKKIRATKYRADFKYVDKQGNTVVEDVKGFKTKEYLLKKKLFLAKYPEIDFREE